MVPEAAIAFLACARIGAVHSVIFAGFSAESLRDRVVDAKSRVVITTDEGKRGGKTIATKSIVDAALAEAPLVEHVLVLKRTGGNVKWTEGRDHWWHEEKLAVQPYCPPEIVSAEDPLFILYTSGSTGKVRSSCPLRSPSMATDFLPLAAQGCRPLVRWLPSRRAHDRQVRLRCAPRRQVRLHGRCRMDYRPHLHRLRPSR